MKLVNPWPGVIHQDSISRVEYNILVCPLKTICTHTNTIRSKENILEEARTFLLPSYLAPFPPPQRLIHLSLSLSSLFVTGQPVCKLKEEGRGVKKKDDSKKARDSSSIFPLGSVLSPFCCVNLFSIPPPPPRPLQPRPWPPTLGWDLYQAYIVPIR